MEVRTLALIVLLLAGAPALFWLWSPNVPPSPSSRAVPDPKSAEPRSPTAPRHPAIAALRTETEVASSPRSNTRPDTPVAPDPDGHDHAPDDSFASERAWYAAQPLSPVPHAIARGWGAAPESQRRGVVGLYVIVDPDLPTRDLEQLARDIYAYHASASELTVRILDSEEAATYDRHVDGGERLHRHIVAMVRRNLHLQVDSIEVRGEPIDP
jgi:hypothetical protein